MTIFNIPRHERTPETEVDVLLTNLSAIYSELHPQSAPNEFIHTHFKEFYENESTDGDTLAAFNESLSPSNDEGIFKVSDKAALVISCAYCVQAQKAHDNGSLNEAWTYITDARFWCDICMSRHRGIDRLRSSETKEAISAIRRASRRNSTDKYDYTEFILNEYQRNPWNNKTTAAQEISEKLRRHIEVNGLPVRKVKTTNERGDVIENEQDDFYKLVFGKLPSSKQVKMDRDNFKKNFQ